MLQKVKHGKDSILPQEEFGGFGKSIHSGWPMEQKPYCTSVNVLH